MADVAGRCGPIIRTIADRAWTWRACVQLAGFVRDGLEADEPAMVVLPSAQLAAVRDELGASAAAEVALVEIEQVGRIPPALPQCAITATPLIPRHRSRGIGEPVWFRRSPAEMSECATHERLFNLACERSLLWLVSL